MTVADKALKQLGEALRDHRVELCLEGSIGMEGMFALRGEHRAARTVAGEQFAAQMSLGLAHDSPRLGIRHAHAFRRAVERAFFGDALQQGGAPAAESTGQVAVVVGDGESGVGGKRHMGSKLVVRSRWHRVRAVDDKILASFSARYRGYLARSRDAGGCVDWTEGGVGDALRLGRPFEVW